MEFNCIIQSSHWTGEELNWDAIIRTAILRAAQDERKAIALVLTDDARIQAFNRDYRGKDKPTNVLSFPSDAPGEWGDILLAYETIAREAAQQGKSFPAHLTHLLVHGTLHLLGYDHEKQAEAAEMEALEMAILSQLGLANPYETD